MIVGINVMIVVIIDTIDVIGIEGTFDEAAVVEEEEVVMIKNEGINIGIGIVIRNDNIIEVSSGV